MSGYPIQMNEPLYTAKGETVALGAFVDPTPGGNMYMYGLFVQQPDGSFNGSMKENPISYPNPGDLFKDVQAKGTIVDYEAWLKTQFQAMLDKEFAVAPTPAPAAVTDDASAHAAIVAMVNSWKVVNGVIQ